MPTSVRLDPEITVLIQRLAKQSGLTKSQIIREALLSFAERRQAKAPRPYDAVKHLLGSADSGGLALSEKTGDKFRKLLTKGKRARGPN